MIFDMFLIFQILVPERIAFGACGDACHLMRSDRIQEQFPSRIHRMARKRAMMLKRYGPFVVLR